MADTDSKVQRLIDESDLRQLLLRSARGITEREPETVLGCFTHDLRIDYGFTVVDGIDAFRTFLSNSAEAKPLPVPGLNDAITRTQLFSTEILTIDGDSAELQSTGLSVHGGVRDEEKYVVVRSLRYNDTCVRRAEGWRIHRRTYTPQWAFEVPAAVVVPLLVAQR